MSRPFSTRAEEVDAEAACEKQQEKIVGLQTQLSAKDAQHQRELSQKNTRLSEQDEQLAAHKQELLELTKRLEAMERQVSTKDQLLSSKDALLATKDDELAAQTHKLAEVMSTVSLTPFKELVDARKSDSAATAKLTETAEVGYATSRGDLRAVYKLRPATTATQGPRSAQPALQKRSSTTSPTRPRTAQHVLPSSMAGGDGRNAVLMRRQQQQQQRQQEPSPHGPHNRINHGGVVVRTMQRTHRRDDLQYRMAAAMAASVSDRDAERVIVGRSDLLRSLGITIGYTQHQARPPPSRAWRVEEEEGSPPPPASGGREPVSPGYDCGTHNGRRLESR